MIHVMDEIDETFQKDRTDTKLFQRVTRTIIFISNGRLFTVKFFKMNDRTIHGRNL